MDFLTRKIVTNHGEKVFSISEFDTKLFDTKFGVKIWENFNLNLKKWFKKFWLKKDWLLILLTLINFQVQKLKMAFRLSRVLNGSISASQLLNAQLRPNLNEFLISQSKII